MIVLPGFLAGPESTAFLGQYLCRLGYHTHDRCQGRNLGMRPGLAGAHAATFPSSCTTATAPG